MLNKKHSQDQIGVKEKKVGRTLIFMLHPLHTNKKNPASNLQWILQPKSWKWPSTIQK